MDNPKTFKGILGKTITSRDMFIAIN